MPSFDFHDVQIPYGIFVIIYTAFGTPITMSNGGINPIKEVILYPRKFNVALESRTPNATTINGTAIARTDLKKLS